MGCHPVADVVFGLIEVS